MHVSDVAVILPMKDPRQAKLRFSPFLSAGERYRLTRAMYADVLSAVRACREAPEIFVVGSNVEDIVSEDAIVITEIKPLGLNRALQMALRIIRQRGFSRALILHCDLPLITSHDVDLLLHESMGVHVLISPSKDETGTNALSLSPPDILSPSYGRESYRKHLSRAKSQGLKVKVFRIQNVAHDIDYPSDLLLLKTTAASSKTRRIIDEIEIDNRLEASQITKFEKRCIRA